MVVLLVIATIAVAVGGYGGVQAHLRPTPATIDGTLGPVRRTFRCDLDHLRPTVGTQVAQIRGATILSVDDREIRVDFRRRRFETPSLASTGNPMEPTS